MRIHFSNNRGSLLKAFLTLILFAVLGVGFLVIWFFYSINEATKAKTNPKLYAGIMADRPQYGNLPKQIPTDASQIAFYHVPGFLQGADEVILRVALPDAKVKQILEDLLKSKRQEVQLKDFDRLGIPIPRALPAFGSKLRKYEDFSEPTTDFRIFLFNCDLDTIHKNWNHHFLAFTAISMQWGEVVYFAENG
ncbi:hypothetical protein LLG95_18520 [bacterium]|nr:hypothetical protein [bacterium]